MFANLSGLLVDTHFLVHSIVIVINSFSVPNLLISLYFSCLSLLWFYFTMFFHLSSLSSCFFILFLSFSPLFLPFIFLLSFLFFLSSSFYLFSFNFLFFFAFLLFSISFFSYPCLFSVFSVFSVVFLTLPRPFPPFLVLLHFCCHRIWCCLQCCGSESGSTGSTSGPPGSGSGSISQRYGSGSFYH